MTFQPEITILVPTLNEERALPLLLADIAAQQEVRIELIVSDGGSTDGTIGVVELMQTAFSPPIQIIIGAAGRPGQIDRGAVRASGKWLLILHADSRLPVSHALRSTLDLLGAAADKRSEAGVAGRFRLCFALCDGIKKTQLVFLEQKARLNRPGCIHGDQGIILATSRFRAMAPLSADIPMLAETRLADRLLAEGEMLLFPHDIITSARRFKAEGMAARQTLNALIMNFAAIGWPAFFAGALPLYLAQNKAPGQLPLANILGNIQTMLQQEPQAERRRIWRATGAYVAANAWQLALMWDLRRTSSPAAPCTRTLDRFDRLLAPLINSPPGQRCAQWLTWCWFQIRRRSAKKNG